MLFCQSTIRMLHLLERNFSENKLNDSFKNIEKPPGFWTETGCLQKIYKNNK